MTYNFAKHQARRVGRRTIITRVAVIALLLVLHFLEGNNLQNLYGPYETFTDSSQLAGLVESRKHYVETEAEYLFDTGYVMTSDGKDKYYYYAFWSGDALVLVETGLDMTQGEYENHTVRGRLAKAESDESELVSGVLVDMAYGMDIETDQAREILSPYIIHSKADPWGARILTGVGLLVIVGALLQILQAVVGMIDYRKTKSYKKLGAQGHGDADWLNETISAEIAQERVRFKQGPVTITEGWAIEQQKNGFRVWPRADVVWVYRVLTRHRTNGIPTGKTHSLNLGMADGKTIVNAPMKNEAAAQQAVDALEACGLTAVFGYMPELEEMYQRDIQGFVALARQPKQPASPAQ